jgi:hypothetical protein
MSLGSEKGQDFFLYNHICKIIKLLGQKHLGKVDKNGTKHV